MGYKFFVLFLLIFLPKIVLGENRLSGNVSCFIPLDSRFRKVYHENSLYQLEYHIQIKEKMPVLNTSFALFGSLGYLYGSGQTNQDSPTHLHYLPLSFGGIVTAPFKNNKLVPYMGLGPVVAYSRAHNGVKSFCCLDKHQNGWGWGGRFRSGMFAAVTPSIFIQFFLDYYLTKIFYHYSCSKAIKSSCYIQGISIGCGCGYKF